MRKLFPLMLVVATFFAANAQTHMRIHTKTGATDILISDFDSITFMTPPPVDPLNGHEYVDLALPSGLMWATMNVGAQKNTDFGTYFAWGETSPKESYDWATYKYAKGTYKTLTKYNCSGSWGVIDGLTTLEPIDDAAVQNWGGDWRMATLEEMRELFNAENVEWTFTQVDDVWGYLGKSVRNQATIFLPSAGSIDNKDPLWNSDLSGENSYGRYWTASLYTTNNVNYDAFYYWFNKNKVDVSGTYRSSGRPVRAVIKLKNQQ